jgi:ribosomal protein L11
MGVNMNKTKQVVNHEAVKENEAIRAVTIELAWARSHFLEMITPHEGYAIIKEELDELWDEIKKKEGTRSNKILRHEAMQVAAMAIRFMTDLTHEEIHAGKSGKTEPKICENC